MRTIRARIPMWLRLGALFVLVSAVAGHPSPIRVPLALIGPERGEYVARDARTQQELWRTRWTVERVSPGSAGSVFRVREEGAGRRWRPEQTRWTISMTVDLSPGRETFSAVRDLRDAFDRRLEIQRRVLDFHARTGSMSIVDQDKRTERSEALTVDETSIPIELLPIQLRALPDTPQRRLRFHLITRDGSSVPMAARIVGQEMVATPAGTFAGYKTELVVTGFRGVVGQLVLPAMYIWHRVDPPHAWLKYRGLDGSVGSPEVVLELVRFEAEGERAP